MRESASAGTASNAAPAKGGVRCTSTVSARGTSETSGICAAVSSSAFFKCRAIRPV